MTKPQAFFDESHLYNKISSDMDSVADPKPNISGNSD